MMIRRDIPDRVGKLAPFLSWDPDPYLVSATTGGWCGSWTATLPANRIPIRGRFEEKARRVQLYPQLDQGHRGCLQRRRQALRVRSIRTR